MNKPIISFKDFTFKYLTQAEPTLKNIDLEIMAGEKILIAGPSGSGKSTLAKCLNGLIPNEDKGEISGSCTFLDMTSPRLHYLISPLRHRRSYKIPIANLSGLLSPKISHLP